MFTLVAFNQSLDATNSWRNIAGCADQTTRVVGDVVYVPSKFTRLIWCSGQGSALVRAKLESPSIRRMGVLMVEPKCSNDYDYFKAFPNMRYTGRSPIPLVAGEGLEAFGYTGSNTSTEQTIGVCLGDSLITPVEGEIWTVRATFSSITLVESTWVNAELTFDETLPVGTYQLVGASAWVQEGALFRFVPIGTLNRPGGVMTGGVGGIEPEIQRLGNMGVWTEFHSSTPPSVEFTGFGDTAAGGSVEMDLIKVA